ncbi:SDR family NAD(P)-dependent oxidoreductase [Mesorhizobium abyssinicae]|uniref:SDR family NAD(P)-dependent oxidoreductase n=1 Tax=Mesorhizobium abyssinicae TaxID=1209958 RepID=UPI0033912C81
MDQPTQATSEGRFKGRVALITGAARGIGFGVASRLAREGASIAIVDLDAEAAGQAASRLPLVGEARAIGVGADVTDATSVETVVMQTQEMLGGLHVLMNNAGVTRDNLLFKMTEDDWDVVMRVHLRGHFLMSRSAQKYMVAQGYGKIVNVSSVSALGARGQANYSAAKMAIQGLTRTLAIELSPRGVNVNAVAPGFIVSDMTDATAVRLGMAPDEFRKLCAEGTPVRRVGYPEDVAAAVSFLASDEASFVTGQTLYIDGGESLPK